MPTDVIPYILWFPKRTLEIPGNLLPMLSLISIFFLLIKKTHITYRMSRKWHFPKSYVVQSVQYRRSFAIAKPNGYGNSVAIVLTVLWNVSIHSTLWVPASAKHSSPVDAKIAKEFGKMTAGLERRISRFDPSRFDCSIFGPSRFQSEK